MTSDQRRWVRHCLVLAKMTLRNQGEDDGTGQYWEEWQHEDGTFVVLRWSPRDSEPVKDWPWIPEKEDVEAPYPEPSSEQVCPKCGIHSHPIVTGKTITTGIGTCGLCGAPRAVTKL